MNANGWTQQDLFLLAFAIGAIWSLASVVLGGAHGFGTHAGHSHLGHATSRPGSPSSHVTGGVHLLEWLLNPSYIAIFLAWFGGMGYVLTRDSGVVLWMNLLVSAAAGVTGVWILSRFLLFLRRREDALDPLDYEMVGVVGQVSATIRPDGFGEILYLREGARRSAPARSEEPRSIERGQEVVVTRFERGVVYVRTWDDLQARLHLKSES